MSLIGPLRSVHKYPSAGVSESLENRYACRRVMSLLICPSCSLNFVVYVAKIYLCKVCAHIPAHFPPNEMNLANLGVGDLITLNSGCDDTYTL